MFKLSQLLIKSVFLSLLKRRLRTLMAITMIAISLWGLMVIQGFYEGMIKQMVDNAIRSDSGQIVLFAKNFRHEKQVNLDISPVKPLITQLNAEKDIKSITTRVLGSGLIATAHYSHNVNIYGINLAQENQNSNFKNYLKQGHYDFGKRQDGVLIGAKLAEKLKLTIGRKLILTAQNSLGEVVSIGLRIKGFLKTDNMTLDRHSIFINIHKAQQFFAIDGVNQISIMLHNATNIQPLRNHLSQQLPKLDVLAWNDLYPALLQTQELMITFNWIIYLVVFIAVIIGIFGVILVSVWERLIEFSILRAIGTSFRQIALMILLESFSIGLLGFIFGVLLGSISLWYLSQYGIDLSAFSHALDEFGIASKIYATIKPDYFLTALSAVCLASIVTILIPLRILKKTKPIRIING